MKRFIIAILLLFFLCIAVVSADTVSNELKIHFFSIDNVPNWGDCAYLEFPNGENMMIDFGYKEAGAQVAQYLLDNDIKSIDHVVFSHCHSDHANGFSEILDNGIVARHAYASGYFPTNYQWLLDRFVNFGIKLHIITAGDSFNIGDVKVEVLWPFAEDLETEKLGATNSSISGPGSNNDMNNKSLVMKITYGKNSVLFTGDIYHEAEAGILKRYADCLDVLDIDVLKVPHHGRETSSSEAFINAVTPVLAVATGTAQMHRRIFAYYVKCGGVGTQSWINGNVFVVMDGENIKFDMDKPGIIEYYQKYLDALKKAGRL